MPSEILILVGAVILGIVQLVIATQLMTKARGTKWNLGNREEKVPELTGIEGRADRAFQNFKETFPFFLAGIFAVFSLNKFGTLSLLGAHLYFWARVVYLPVYLSGILYIRTAIWCVSMLGIVLILASLC